MRNKVAITILAAFSLSGCGTLFDGKLSAPQDNQVSATIGETESGYTYIPVDPFPVQVELSSSCKEYKNPTTPLLLDSLPDNAVRMLVERFDKSGSITYGTSKSGIKDESYRVTVDYINVDTINVAIAIEKMMEKIDGSGKSYVNLFATDLSTYVPGTEQYAVTRLSDEKAQDRSSGIFNIPVYVGVGLRISSTVNVTSDSANISGIGVIGAEAEANKLKGSLVVQTLGVNGKSVAAALPIQSELNRTTAQNAIVAVGSIKALLYSPETITSPRVVGFYLPFPGGKALVNAIISELSKNLATWKRACPPPRQ